VSKPDTEQLDRLIEWMREGGFQRLTYSKGKGKSITLALPDTGGAAVARPLRTILSPGMGIFTLRHPVAAAPYVGVGQKVAAGEVVALLAVGPVLTAVESPCDGVVRRVLAEEGAVIGYEDPLFEIEPAGV